PMSTSLLPYTTLFRSGGRECDVDVGALGLLEHPGDEPLAQFRVKDTPDLVVLVAGAAFRLPHEGHMVTARRNDGELGPLSGPHPAEILLLGRSLAQNEQAATLGPGPARSPPKIGFSAETPGRTPVRLRFPRRHRRSPPGRPGPRRTVRHRSAARPHSGQRGSGAQDSPRCAA